MRYANALAIIACSTLYLADAGEAHAVGVETSTGNLTLTIDPYSESKWFDQVDSLDRTVIETFESIGSLGGEREGGFSGIETNVGRFGRDMARIAGDEHDGSGGSIIGTGKQVAIRSGNNWGRESTTPAGWPGGPTDKRDGYFLDSNDLSDVYWSVDPGDGLAFRTLSFVVTDAGDVGGRFGLEVNGTEIYSHSRDDGDELPNGLQLRFTIDFGQWLTSDDVLIHFAFDRKNDGIGIDDIVIGVTEVPLPAAFWLLAAGSGLLGFRSYRRRVRLT